MNQITVSGFDEELKARIQFLARSEGISLNQAVLKLLQKGAGMPDTADAPNMVGSSLDHLIGTWTQAEVDEMDDALKEFETIDEALWR